MQICVILYFSNYLSVKDCLHVFARIIMATLHLPLSLRFKLLLNACTVVFSSWQYILAGILTALFISGAIIWSLNLSLIQYVIFDAPVSAYDKLTFFGTTYQTLFTTFDSVQSVGIIVFSILFGLNAMLLAYVIRAKGVWAIPKSGGGGVVLAVLGGGCVACGTSLLAPLLATVGATSTVAARQIGSVFLWLGSALTVYSIFSISKRIPRRDSAIKGRA
jgi:hypothetical protein